MAKVYELLSRQLIGLGSDTIFGLVGSGNFFLAESLVIHGAKFVAARHEAGALAMADAWARLTQKVGICTVHMGPGFTNIITPLVEAAKARTPLLVLTADVSTGAVTSTFAIDIDALATASGAIPERLWKNSTATQDLVRAYRRARYERRPVVFVMPQDIQAAESTAAVIAPEDNAYFSVIPDRSILEKIVSLVRDSRHPLILAGRGSVLAGARAGLEKLAEAIGALLATTANAHGLFAGNPWSIGIAGGFSSPGAVELFRQADLILAFGASLTVWTRRHGRLFPESCPIVQIDLDPAALHRQYPVTLACVGDARATAEALLELVPDKPVGQWRTPSTLQFIQEHSWINTPFEDASTENTIDPRTLSLFLEQNLPPDRILVLDSGHFMAYPVMYLSVPDGKGFVFTQALQSIGFGLPNAIGAAIAYPDRLTIAATGDGGLLLSLSELETVARYRLPILIVVYNDAAYGAEVHHFAPMGWPTSTVQFPDTNIAELARALGMHAFTVRTQRDLESLRAALSDRSCYPMLLDAKVNPAVRGGEWFDLAFEGH